jgi:hypothetical protein
MFNRFSDSEISSDNPQDDFAEFVRKFDANAKFLTDE